MFDGLRDQTVYEYNSHNTENWGGLLGADVANYFMKKMYGFSSIFIPIFLIAWSVKLMNAYRVRLWKWFLNCTFLMVWTSLLFTIIGEGALNNSWSDKFAFSPGGLYGVDTKKLITEYVGDWGFYLLIVISAIFYFVYLSRETINVVRNLLKPQEIIKKSIVKYKKDNVNNEEYEGEEDMDEVQEMDEDVEDANDVEHIYEDTSTYKITMSTDEADVDDTTLTIESDNEQFENETALILEDTIQDHKADGMVHDSVENLEPYDPRKDLENYKFPKLDLLKKYTDNSPAIDMEEQNNNKNRIIAVLKSFGVEISSISATIGPTITLYEITPAAGVRISKIRNLEDDIALSLSALGIRIIAPIPGKGTIGIEVPNKNPRIVSMESILNSKKRHSTFPSP
jgi:S-DNA-T family DNA segregation ATPase FtsK/SpoIIIE